MLTSSNRSCSSLLALAIIAIMVGSGQLSRAHEGHRPLPTRGMELDVGGGKMVLTKSACETLDVQTVEVVPKTIQREVMAYGTLQSPWSGHALITSALPGRIVALYVAPGEAIHAGQLLAELESPELDLLQLELRTAQIGLNLANRIVNSTETASQLGALAVNRFIESQSRQQQDQAAVEIACAKWRALHLPEDTLESILRHPEQAIKQRMALTAPIDGTIAHADLSVGKIVDPKEHLFEVFNHAVIWLRIDVLEKDLSDLTLGREVELVLTAFPGDSFKGTIDVVDDYFDPVTHQGRAWATFTNDSPETPKLLPGMSGQVRIRQSSNRESLALPKAAIIRNGAERFVFVEVESTQRASTFQKQAVTLGKHDSAFIEVLGGNVLPGDRVMTRGSHELGSFFAQGTLNVSRETAEDIQLITAEVAWGEIHETISFDGTIYIPPAYRTIASAQFNGKIERVFVDRGQRVQKGEVLAEISSQEFQNLQLELLKADLEVRLRQSLVTSLGQAKGALSDRQLWEAESKLNQSQSSRDAAIHRLRAAGVTEEQIDRLKASRELVPSLAIRAPIDGSLINFDRFLGHNVRADEPLFEIHDMSHAWVQGYLSERDLARIQIGQPVRIRFTAGDEQFIQGTIVRSGQTVGELDRTAWVWIEMQRLPKLTLRQNMLARLTVEVGPTSGMLVVPRDAVIKEATRSFVFVRNSKQAFERRLIEPFMANDLFVGVRSGLVEGESIAVHGASQLQSG